MIVSDDHYSINLLSNECTSVIAKIVLAINKGVCTKYSFIDASLKSINLNNKSFYLLSDYYFNSSNNFSVSFNFKFK